tara:strand:+ start:64 stop:408 length:345 start_codon:yes stop_codon:yes gene_type:complete
MESPKAIHLGPVGNEIIDWGNIDSPIGSQISSVSGYLLDKSESHEMGYWQCSEGEWDCHVTKNEFCHFIEGECIYTSEDGSIINISSGSIAFFPKDWNGKCKVVKKIKKFYCIF